MCRRLDIAMRWRWQDYQGRSGLYAPGWNGMRDRILGRKQIITRAEGCYYEKMKRPYRWIEMGYRSGGFGRGATGVCQQRLGIGLGRAGLIPQVLHFSASSKSTGPRGRPACDCGTVARLRESKHVKCAHA